MATSDATLIPENAGRSHLLQAICGEWVLVKNLQFLFVEIIRWGVGRHRDLNDYSIAHNKSVHQPITLIKTVDLVFENILQYLIEFNNYQLPKNKKQNMLPRWLKKPHTQSCRRL